MKLWILQGSVEVAAFDPWYDKAFGFVVRAESKDEARRIASEEAGDEGAAAWLDPAQTTCAMLEDAGDPGILLRDFASA